MKNIKYLMHLALILFSLFMLTGCPWWETEGEIEIVNNGSEGTITWVNIDTDCNNGWSGSHSTSIPEGSSRSFEVDAGDYDIRACTYFSGNWYCEIWRSEWVDWDETRSFYYYSGTIGRDSSC